jgi:phage baseplate assembly protein W
MKTPTIEVVQEVGVTLPADVLECLRCLLGCLVGQQCLDRDFGIDWAALDAPVDRAKMLVTREIIQKIRHYEPRCNVDRVDFFGNHAVGQLTVKVVVSLV